jgi:hypothetical protein
MADLFERSRSLEQKLADIDAPLIEIALTVLRELLETEPDNVALAHRLEGALAVAEVTLEQLNAPAAPFALDGDVHYRHGSTAPGKATRRLLERFIAAEREASTQRAALLMPLCTAAMRQADSELSGSTN